VLIIKERQSIRTIGGWATFVLLETGAIRECQEHGWMKDRTDPHARHRAIEIARSDPPPGVSQDEAVAAVENALNSIGDTCPECPPNDD
jgi:hypothetical protein